MRTVLGDGLRHLLGGYFHEDFDLVGTDVGELLAAFVANESTDVVIRAANDAAALLARGLGEQRLAALLDMSYDLAVEGMTHEGLLREVAALRPR